MIAEFAPFGTATPTAIAEFERRNRVSLPDDYRAVLAVSNGGLLKRAVARIKGPGEELLVEVVLGLGLKASF